MYLGLHDSKSNERQAASRHAVLEAFEATGDKASDFQSGDPGLDPPAGEGERQVLCPSESIPVQTCLCLTPLRV